MERGCMGGLVGESIWRGGAGVDLVGRVYGEGVDLVNVASPLSSMFMVDTNWLRSHTLCPFR